ncbi:putative membrane-associated Zn-dependent protease [Actinoalloteichus hymeniacidonis]|uniref:Membrane-associated Zn-dependent protease n=1 Tax=Actinoalloteichus hymeniacidonis TaxID=340345 RepID=A0AAC9HNS1_9PSEU|nr:putative membrane-associated Zn-dependent protease [Actinoalloteichus hymeniacidonis]
MSPQATPWLKGNDDVAFVIGVILFALGIGISIALHELGHLAAAKAFKMKVTEYFVGFGPKIFSFRRGETEYGLKAIPAGGYCRIIGMTALEEVEPHETARAMYNKPVWQRVIVLSAGSLVHFILGFLILLIMAFSLGLPNIDGRASVGVISDCVSDQNPETGQLVPCAPGDPSPARDAGIQPGDEIIAVGGAATPLYTDVLEQTRDAEGPTEFTIVRDGTEQTVTVDVATVDRLPLDGGEGLESVGAIGLGQAATFHYDGLAAVPATLDFTGTMFVETFQRLLELPERIPALFTAIFGGERDVNTPVSVVGASIIGGDAVEQGLWELFLLLLATLNFFVGVFNLLPLLPLDGGHIAVNVYERVRDTVRGWRGKPRGGPVDYTKLLPLTYAAVFVGGAFVLLTLTADIVNPLRLTP